ncbi:ribosomal RNA small subunit methyltransferase A [Anaplasmataceae bacterium AB001_6]|nr:ribosomal RNA small subunit methyltransferase A [Anaplasmataceae bacterium AB001_6]
MVFPKKSLGQHFLKDDSVVQNIIDFAGDLSGVNVLEIGPGKGIVTKKILSKDVSKMFAIEKDSRFTNHLQDIKNHYTNFDFAICDFIQTNLLHFNLHNFKVIANLPYNVGNNILMKLINEYSEEIIDMTLMFQKEVAERICATHGKKYGKLSVVVQLMCDVIYGFDVNASSFAPPPKVESSVIKIVPRKNLTLDFDFSLFLQIVSAVFNNRRKMIRKTLATLCDNINDISSVVDLSKRPEDISVTEFCNITRTIQKNI